MTARTGMSVMIETLRGFCNAGTNDATIGTTVYWSDDEVQRVLDRHKTHIIREELTPFEIYTGAGTIEYLEYRSAFGNIESGTAVFEIEAGDGSTIGTSTYAGNYPEGIFTFTSDQVGSARYMTGYTYDIYAAAADIWQMKMTQVASGVDFTTDNMRVNRGQLIKNYKDMYDFYIRKAGAPVFNFTRDDSTILGDW